jgi:zinc protease
MNLRMKFLIFCASIFGLAIWAAAGALALSQSLPLPKGVERVTTVEGITEYRLENGLRVLLFPDRTKQTITVNITYLVGSRHENYGETGMAHLLEHLLFKGTPNHTNIVEEMTARGTRRNGSTSWDRTNYYETFAANEENLRWALELESDRMVNSFVAKKDLDSEMTVVRNELERSENDVERTMVFRLFSGAFQWHNYGKKPVGERSDIENVPIDRLQAFYKYYYQPDNAVLLLTGRFDEMKTIELANEYFGKIPKPARELRKFYTTEPVQDGERVVTMRRVGDIQLLAAAYHIPSGAHPDASTAAILTRILGDSPSGRLHKALIEGKKASLVASDIYALADPGLVYVGAGLGPDQPLEQARDTMLEVVEEIAKNPVTKEEVDRARGQLLKQIELTLTSSETLGMQLSEWIAKGDWRLLFIHRDRLRKVMPEEVQRVAALYFKPANRTMVYFIPTAKPDRTEIPPKPDVLALVKDYKGDVALEEGENFDPSPINIDSRTHHSSTPGGLKLALLPKKTRGATVVANLTLEMGDEKSLTNRVADSQLAALMLDRGSARHSRQQIKDEFDKLRAQVSIVPGESSVNLTIETTRDNLPAVLRLVGEILREPSFPANEFEQLKQETLASIEIERGEPTVVASIAMERHIKPYPKGHPKYVYTKEEEIAELKAAKLENVKKFHSEFYGAQSGELAVVGDFNEKEITKLAGEIFGKWKSQRPFKRISESYKDVGIRNQSFETPDKANAFFIAAINLNLRDDDLDYPALVLGNYMLGGAVGNSRLMARIRGKEGLSYGVASRLQVSSLDKNGYFTGYAIYAPQNAAKVEAAFKDEITRALKDGFTANEVKTAKNGWLQLRKVARSQDKELAEKLRNFAYLSRNLEWDAEFEKKVEALTPEQINAAMRKYIDPAKLSIIKAGDFAKTSMSQAK